ncbi:hypothetical protein KEM56_003404 [Ascosphaera pollenicola]|nr:hypothetical protein KEM56_003404 [Ascosphaera pollenicola]
MLRSASASASSSRALLSVASGAARFQAPSTALSSPQWLRQSRARMSGRGAAALLAGDRYYSATTRLFAEDNKNAAKSSETPSSSTSSPSSSSSTPPPPSPPPKPKHRVRKFLTYLFLTSAALYSGGVYLSLKSDNFHDFFSEYVPFGEEAVLYFEERDFRRRFPNASTENPAPKKEFPASERLLIKPQSGVTPVPAQDRKPDTSPAVESSVEEVKEVVKDDEKKGPVEERQVLRDDKGNAPIDIEIIDSEVANMVQVFNELAVRLNQEEPRYSGKVNALRASILKVVEEVATIRQEVKAAAEAEINKLHEQFDQSAKELLKRIETVRTEDAAQFREEFESERERLSKGYSAKVVTELARAQELNEQRLRNELVEQAIEINRKFVSEIHTLVEKERGGRLNKIKELTANVGELETLTSEYNGLVDITQKTQQLQVAIDAVKTALESEVPRPFVRELAAVQAVGAADPVIASAIASIAPESYQHGIPTQAQIIDRFRRVAAEVRKASLLPENAGITSHVASMVLSKVLFKQHANNGKAGTSEQTEDVLGRTQALLEEGNLDEAAREMNGLTGWAKVLSKDWLKDVRQVLEVKQALQVMETEARLRTLSID